MLRYFTIAILSLFTSCLVKANSVSQMTLVIDDEFEEKIIGEYFEIYQDDKGLDFEDVLQQNKFVPNQIFIPNLGLTSSYIWLKVNIENKSSRSDFLLDVEYPILDEVEFFYPRENNVYESIYLTERYDKAREYKSPNYVFDLFLNNGEKKTYYIKLKNTEQVILPISIKTVKSFWEVVTIKNIINGIYIGIILIMFFYNIFIFFSTRSKSYLFYIIYVLATGLTHMGIQGYSLNYFFSNLHFDGSMLTIYASIAGISVIMFTKTFLRTRKNLKKGDYGLTALLVLLSISLVLTTLGLNDIGFNLMQISTTLFSLYILIISHYLLYKGFQPAKFFALAWSIVLVGAIIFLLKDFGILPYNDFTNHSMQAATALEMILLSFALANRINIMREEKETAQKEALQVLEENERIIQEQNTMLEQQVAERTVELNDTLTNLKETQSQLVDAEKMSSLGQLTAGIAHEINNPINYVSSNISPLRQDLEDMNAILNKYDEIDEQSNIADKLKEVEQLKKELDYDYLKTEIYSIMNGIEDGANRTTEIVKGLRNFSRLDESELKIVNINEGVESTLVLIKNKLNGIQIKKNLGPIPDCECNAGKINQLIMNLLDNSIYAIEKKEIRNQDGEINVLTTSDDTYVILHIKDNGIGIKDEIKEKLFEPFFTTKDVGEGTGLGLSIVHSIVDSHNGKIAVNSEVNVGTEIVVKIPIKSIS